MAITKNIFIIPTKKERCKANIFTHFYSNTTYYQLKNDIYGSKQLKSKIMKKKILGIGIICAVTIALTLEMNHSSHKNLLTLANIEALAKGDETTTEDKEKTYQVGEKTITSGKKYSTTEPGWSWDVKAGVWLFEGKVSHSKPSHYTEDSSSESVKIKCCREKGPDTSCSYETC